MLIFSDIVEKMLFEVAHKTILCEKTIATLLALVGHIKIQIFVDAISSFKNK
jgi:hypothetical protein